MTAPPPTLHLVVPGPLGQRTGGYLYDARMVAELRASGWSVEVHELDGRFPEPDAEATASLDGCLSDVADGAAVVVDGLAMGGLPDVVAAHAARLRIVALVHHPLADETGITADAAERLRTSEGAALAPVRGVVVTSRFTAGRLRDYGVSPDRVRVVEPGTEVAVLADGPPPGSPPRLVCVGTLSPRKGQLLLVRALARISDVAWSCALAGSLSRDADYARRVVDEVAELGLEDRIDFPGELESDALDALYRSASLFVLPSFYEGYGMALAEALARGLPIVSTTGGAIPFTVPDSAALLVEPGDVDGLVDALRALLEDPTRRAGLAARARVHARTLPSWAEQARRFGASVLELTRP